MGFQGSTLTSTLTAFVQFVHKDFMPSRVMKISC